MLGQKTFQKRWYSFTNIYSSYLVFNSVLTYSVLYNNINVIKKYFINLKIIILEMSSCKSHSITLVSSFKFGYTDIQEYTTKHFDLCVADKVKCALTLSVLYSSFPTLL